METKVLKVDPADRDYFEKISLAAEIIKSGGLVIFPTETVYGLGADATSSEAAKKIYAAKGRPSDNPLIIHVSTPEEAEKYTYTNEVYYKLAAKFMPGPLTVVLPSKDSIPKETRASLPTVAVRCPECRIARDLISSSGVPIAAPSANLSGSPSPTTAKHVIDDMLGRVDMIIDGGDSDFGLESTIVKIEDDSSLTLLRPGKITVDDLLSVVDTVAIADAVTSKLAEGEKVLSPGMKYRHYAPKAPLLLVDEMADEFFDFVKNENYGKIAVITYTEDAIRVKKVLPEADLFVIGSKADELSQAHNLFSVLRETDNDSYDMIFAPLPSTDGIGLALYNRMIRAAAHKILKFKK